MKATRRSAVYYGEQAFGDSTCKSRLEVYDDGDELNLKEGLFGSLDLTWSGGFEHPEEWRVLWHHYLGFLGYNVPSYLSQYAPAPKEILKTLKDSLPEEFRAHFETDPKIQDAPEP